MNERIKELLDQATEVYDQWHRGESVCMVDHQMFAELIVRECLSYAKEGDLDFMKFMIKKNFGVEE